MVKLTTCLFKHLQHWKTVQTQNAGSDSNLRCLHKFPAKNLKRIKNKPDTQNDEQTSEFQSKNSSIGIDG